ncbi:MAG: hypothetical protein N2578_07815, partial [Bdellovibrionaceae bacterium]|nr:hypothetical protein [Pseudobdellovibrionaceae bacterium]
DRDDSDPITLSRMKNPSYSLLGLSGSTDLSKDMKFFVRIENALDQDYEAVAGYGSPRRSIFGGISGQF